MSGYMIASGFLTHSEAVQALHELSEDPDIGGSENLDVDCYYTKTKELRYGVKFLDPEDRE